MAKATMKQQPTPTKETVSNPKKEKVFSDLVIKEIMIQKNMTHDEAKAHLEKYHK